MNTTQMRETIYKVFMHDIEGLSLDELRAELSYYIENEVINMGSEEIQATYNYLAEMGQA